MSLFQLQIYKHLSQIIILLKQMNRTCCSKSFIHNQIIPQPQSSTYEYKMYSYPFSNQNKDIILKTIVSLLNKQGGYLFIGIQQTKQKRRIAKGLTLNQTQKDDIHKLIRSFQNSIKPDIGFLNKISVSYVPVKQESERNYIQGKYIIKITVSPGNPKLLYQFKGKSGKYECYIRERDECVKVQSKRRIKQLRSIRQSSMARQVQMHQCTEPDLGYLLYDEFDSFDSFYNRVQKKLIKQQISLSDHVLHSQNVCTRNQKVQKMEKEQVSNNKEEITCSGKLCFFVLLVGAIAYICLV